MDTRELKNSNDWKDKFTREDQQIEDGRRMNQRARISQ